MKKQDVAQSTAKERKIKSRGRFAFGAVRIYLERAVLI